MQPVSLRLMADDLTGALDSAAELASLVGPVPTRWSPIDLGTLPASAAFDTGTREATEAQARLAAGSAAPALHDGAIAFKKIDSLLRGHPVAELAACLGTGAWPYCVLAPAFPHHGRATRNGQQHARTPSGNWEQVGLHLVDSLAAEGFAARLGDPCAVLAPGITVFDAEEDAELQAAVQAGLRAPGRVLWCGSGGLAHALAQAHGADPVIASSPQTPILGIFGSDHPATAAQLAACGSAWISLADGGPRSAARVDTALQQNGVALVSFALSPPTHRARAAERIATEIGRLLNWLDPPQSLLVAGGETLRSLCHALGATGLEVQGRLAPGLPCSVLRGGRWPGVHVVSKSGAFGTASLLHDLLPDFVRRTSACPAISR